MEGGAETGPAARFPLELAAGPHDGTLALTFPSDVPGALALQPCTRYAFTLLRDGERLATAYGWTAPASRATAPRHFSFGAFSCHQPFRADGGLLPEAVSMLRAAKKALAEADARFVLMMGDQAYADYPPRFSLFEPSHFQTIAPPGRNSLLECTREEVRSIYQQRYRIFWGCEAFDALQRSVASYPMLDDHEVVDNFGTHPDHCTPAWSALRDGALDAYYDYQGSRVHRRGVDGQRPSRFDYGFSWGPVAVWGMDIRSNRKTVGGVTSVYDDAQLQALTAFLSAHGELPLAVVMLPIPLVHMQGWLVNTASRMLSQGSDLHERWSHAQCIEARDRLVTRLLQHAQAHPHQSILLLGGDVHCGAAFRIDFDNGVTMHQLTSSAVSHRESPVVARAVERATIVSSITVETAHEVDERYGSLVGKVDLLPGIDASTSHNPFGELNIGIVDVIDHGDAVSVGLRLVSHDGDGNPVTVFDSGALQRLRAHPRVHGEPQAMPSRRA